MTSQVVVRGTVTSDGKLELGEPIGLPPGPVEVTVTALVVRASPTGTWWDVLQQIWDAQEARGFVGRTREEIDEDVRQMRDEWEEHQLSIERLQHESRKAREGAAKPAEGKP